MVIVMAVAVAVTFVPVFGGEVSAASPNRIEFRNIDSYTVLAKGKKLKIKTVRYGKAAKKKVRFATSKKKVATVSSKGVIKAKKNGTVTITAYVKIKGKKRYKTSVKIRVGKQVTSIKVKGDNCVRVGKTITLKATAYPKSAKVRSVWWTSSNDGIARVSDSGVVTGVGDGKVTIQAIARDGSGVKASRTVHVYRFYKNEVKWVAHRGLHTSAKENSRQAMEAAGKAGFYGCECDIFETKRVKEVIPGEGDDPGKEVETFELVLDHDGNFNRVYGVNRNVWDMTSEDIRNHAKLKDYVCFLDEYLDICKRYNMVPVIEMKAALSDDGIAKMAKAIYNRGGKSALERASFISFTFDNLVRTREHIRSVYGISRPNITYLMNPGTSASGKTTALANAEKAYNAGFTGVSIAWGSMFDEFDQYCRSHGLKMDLWTFKNNSSGWYNLHRFMKHKGYQVDRYTVDYKPW